MGDCNSSLEYVDLKVVIIIKVHCRIELYKQLETLISCTNLILEISHETRLTVITLQR